MLLLRILAPYLDILLEKGKVLSELDDVQIEPFPNKMRINRCQPNIPNFIETASGLFIAFDNTFSK